VLKPVSPLFEVPLANSQDLIFCIFRLAPEFAGLRYISQKYTTEIQEEEYQKALDVAEFWGTGPPKNHGHSWESENPSP
jgi:hypothetical protein